MERYTDSNGAPRVRVQVTAADEADGSGVDRIEWLHTTADSPAFNRYADVLDLPATGDLYLRTIDRAGNFDPIYQQVRLG